MIFSLFGKKDGRRDDRKPRPAGEVPPSRPAPLPPTATGRPADPREIARLTAAKIDEIESEMIAPPRPAPVAGARMAPAPSQAGLAGTVYVPSGAAAAAAAAGAAPAPAAKAAPAKDPDTSIILGEARDGGSVEVVGSSLPPAFEEAAVLYANGQGDAAAMILWQSIKENALGNHLRQAWSMLFDLYLANGDQQAFESLAIDYSARFETSPPTWDPAFARAVPDAAKATAPGAPAVVALPVTLDAQVVKQLEQVQRFAQRNRAVAIDATAVRSVDAIGADLLRRVLVAFAKARRELALVGAESLSTVVGGSIEAGRRDASDACWQLQLELLRLLGRQQQFEDLSIDFCVTYEVSPPSWEPMPASVRAAAPGSVTAAEAAPRAAADSGFSVQPDAIVLRGEVEGRAAELLAALRTTAAERAEIVIDCRDLRRLDFVAAGELLNEVVALRTGGKYLVFRDVSHIVAALLAVMGIPDLAEIRLRRH